MHIQTRISTRGIAAGCLSLLALAAGSAQAGVVLSYPSFAGACGTTLTCVGSAAEAGTQLNLTPASGGAGAGYSTTPITLGAGATFSTTFQFQISRASGIAPADGLTFVVAAGSSGLGGAGGGLGYFGVPNSMAVEFDTFNNGAVDGNTSNHVGVDTNGGLASAPLVNPYGVTTCDFSSGYLKPGCLSNGNIWTVTIGYDGFDLDVTVQDGSAAPQALISNFAINLSTVLGTNTAFVGFTSATGAGLAQHTILNWKLANDTSLGPTVPEPATLGLVALSLLGLAASRRTRRL